MMRERARIERRERSRERARISGLSAAKMLIEIGRFGVVDARYYDWHLLRELRVLGAVRMRKDSIEEFPIAFLTRDGKGAARQLAPRDVMIRGALKSKYIDHDLAVHRLYYEEKEAIERDGGKVLAVRTDVEFKRDLGRSIKGSSNMRAAVHDFARRHDLSVIEGGVRIPDCRVVYEMDGEIRHVDLEIASAHRGAKSVQAKQAAGMRVVDRNRTSRSLDRHNDMARLLGC